MQGVPAEIIDRYTVYSEETAAAMAGACRSTYRADIGVGVTGTMGNQDPANAEASVPGEVFFAICIEGETKTYHIQVEPLQSRLMYKLAVADAIAGRLFELID